MNRIFKNSITAMVNVVGVSLFSMTVLLSCSKSLSLDSSDPTKRKDVSVVFAPSETYATMRIPALVITHAGTLLAFCEGRIGTTSDWAEMDLLMRRSTDGGKTWGPMMVMAERGGMTPAGNPVPIVDNSGTIHLLYQRDYARVFYKKSTDDGQTWSDPVEITATVAAFRPEYKWKVLATGPGHAIQLKNGRLVVPVWMADPIKLVPKRGHFPSRVATIYSDDTGRTWKRGALIPEDTLVFNTIKNPNETVLVQLEDGRVMANIRPHTGIHNRGISYSPDGISNWKIPLKHEALFEPVCMASMIRIPAQSPDEPGSLLFINPDSRNLPKFPRKNLTAKISFDDGVTWPVKKVIEEGNSGYNDVAVGADGTIYCMYETNAPGKGFYYTLVLQKFNQNWMLGRRRKR